MTDLLQLAAWNLVAANVISVLYEWWRATAKAGVSPHDSMRMFLTQGAVIYGVAAVVIGLMFADVSGAAWIGLGYSVISIGVSVLYYNPVVMPERDPGLFDWVEDLVFTGLLFVAAALLVLEVAGKSLM